MQKSQQVMAAALVLSVAALSACQMQPPAVKAPRPIEARHAAAHAGLASVSLFPNGVGFFQYQGQVQNNGRQTLYFRSGQINDVLKSMVFQDASGGQVSEAVFPSSQPLSVTLNSFLVNLNGHPSLARLLEQLRGQRIVLRVRGKHGGRVVGRLVDMHRAQRPKHVAPPPRIPAPAPPPPKVRSSQTINMYSHGRLLRIPLKRVQSVRVENPRLQRAFKQALAALAHQPNRHKRPVTLVFHGHGSRTVRFGYLLETPLWRMTYRLILPGKNLRQVPLARAVSRTRGPGGRPAGDFPQTATLEAMAIIHNQTDMDWRHVGLHLVGQMPSSFYENLYQPLYVRRPAVQLSPGIALRPQTYGRGYSTPRPSQPWAPVQNRPQLQQFGRKRLRAAISAYAGRPAAVAAKYSDLLLYPGDWREISASAAHAGKAHPAYNYIIPSVSVRRQHSAMVVVLVTKMRVARVDYYHPDQSGAHPMMAVRLHNISGKYLLHGPVTVFAGAKYAGDAHLSAMAARQTRLLPFAVDQAVSIHAAPQKYLTHLLRARIKGGNLFLHEADLTIFGYRIRNRAAHARRLVIKLSTAGRFVFPPPLAALKPQHHVVRWQILAPPGKDRVVTIRKQGISTNEEPLTGLTAPQLRSVARTHHLPKNVKTALLHAASLREHADHQTAMVASLQAQQVLLQATEQNIRKDLRSLKHAGKVYSALASRLMAYEHKIETNFALIHKAQRKVGLLQARLNHFWKITNVRGTARPPV